MNTNSFKLDDLYYRRDLNTKMQRLYRKKIQELEDKYEKLAIEWCALQNEIETTETKETIR